MPPDTWTKRIWVVDNVDSPYFCRAYSPSKSTENTIDVAGRDLGTPSNQLQPPKEEK